MPQFIRWVVDAFGWMHGLWHSRRTGQPHVKPPPFGEFRQRLLALRRLGGGRNPSQT